MLPQIPGLMQARFEIGRLGLPQGPCHIRCAVEMARSAGATYTLWSAIERTGGELRVVTSLMSVISGQSIHDSRSMWVNETRQLKLGVDQVSREIAGMLVRSSKPVSGPSYSSWNTGAGSNPADVAGAMAVYRQKTLDSPEYADARSGRNGGGAPFIPGFIPDSVGGGLIGAGLPLGNTTLVVAGGIVSGVGTIMFFTGLGVWVANQIKMNKLERGIPLGRSLRLDGLASIVAGGDRGAPGLSARFVF